MLRRGAREAGRSPRRRRRRTASDIAIQADLFRRTKRELNELQSLHTGQPIEQIEKDSDRDRWFTSQEALEYGFVDHVVSRAAMTDNSNPVTDN